jgi:hypothetical protein
VIEIQHQWIGLAAIDTWVVEQKLNQTTQVLGYIYGVVSAGVGDVRRPIADVVGPIPCFVAGTTERVKTSSRAVLEGEFADYFDFPAAGAAFLTPLAVHGIV